MYHINIISMQNIILMPKVRDEGNKEKKLLINMLDTEIL